MEQQSSLSYLHERRLRQKDGAIGRAQRRPAPLRTDIGARFSTAKPQATPPETPRSLETIQPQSASRAFFHNYLRAFCHFEPPAYVNKADKALVTTVALEAGDLILVHSVHANGWADGTVLSTGARGWLPTNYCEAYDHASMRHLLNATTQFWDLLRINEDSNLSTFVRQDYVRPLIAGVRHLLEHADCLHRDAALVQRNAAIRRLRKGLLADLSILVQIAKRLQEVINEPFVGEVIHVLLDDLMARAFKVVTRAVGFVDMLGQERTSITSPKAVQHSDTTDNSVPCETDAHRTDSPQIDSAICFSAASTPMNDSIKPDSEIGATHRNKRKDASAERTPKRTSGLVSHRLSMIRTENSRSKSLASEQLALAHDLCISHIGSFIGLYLHSSRAASELAMTTDRLVSACKTLLTIAEKVSIYEPQPKSTVQQARRSFQLKLDELTTSTKDVFVHSEHVEDDVVMLPDQTNRLIDVGTSLIRTVGDCVVKTRKVIEQVGDFDLDDPPVRGEEVDQELHTVPEERAKTELSEPATEGQDNISMTVPATHPSSRRRASIATEVHNVDDMTPTTTPDAMRPKSPLPPPAHHSLPLPARPGGEREHTTNPNQNGSNRPEVFVTHSLNLDRQCSVGPSIAGSTDTHPTGLR